MILLLFAGCDFIEHLRIVSENINKDKQGQFTDFTADSKVWEENFKQNRNLKNNI